MQVRCGLEAPEGGTYQQRVGHMRLLGEMYNFRLVDSRSVSLYTAAWWSKLLACCAAVNHRCACTACHTVAVDTMSRADSTAVCRMCQYVQQASGAACCIHPVLAQ